MSVKRALICAPLMPEYDRESGSRRIYDLVALLREAGWAVSFVAQNARGGERYAKVLQQRGVATYAGFESITDEFVTASRFDLAIFAFWHIAEQLLPVIRALSPSTRVIVDSIDLHYIRNARRVFRRSGKSQPGSVLDSDYASEMIREVNTYAAADAVLAVSQKEADQINDLVGDPTLAYVVPDNEELMPSTIPFRERKGIVFVGNFRHSPNVEAAEYLCRDILPRLDPAIMVEHPVYIVGNALDDTVRSFGSELPYVHMVGWVPSVLPYLQHARISVIPLLYGAGTKRKLIQALMIGTPTVSTSIGIEGLNLRDGEHVLVADDPAAFATSIAQLLEDMELWQHLAQQGRIHIIPRHGREVVRKRLMQVITDVLAKEAKSMGLAETTPNLQQHRRQQQYQQLVHRIREIVRTTLPLGAKVVVVSKGDDDLVQFDSRQGWHFPQLEGGGPEQLFSQGAEGSVEVPWIRKDTTYEFRLYAGTEPRKLLATVTITGGGEASCTATSTSVSSEAEAFLSATPNSLSANDGLVSTMISWSTGDGSVGEVYVSLHGVYAGYYPVDSIAAISHLEWLRAKGGDFLLFPKPAFWWFDYYSEFKQYLEQHYHLVTRQDDICLIFALHEPAAEHKQESHIPIAASLSVATDSTTGTLGDRKLVLG